jgi:hypothetical protein
MQPSAHCASHTYLPTATNQCNTCPAALQGFFSPLPHSIAARLRALACVPTESGELVEPSRAVVCSSEAVRALVSGPMASRLLGLHFVAGECSALQGSAALRQLLCVQEFSPGQVLGLVRRVCEVGGCC